MRRSSDRQDGSRTRQGDEARGSALGPHGSMEVRAVHARGPRAQGLHPGGRDPPVSDQGPRSRGRSRQFVREVRGAQPHRFLQGPRHDHRGLPRQRARSQGRGMRLHREHLRRPCGICGQGRDEVRRLPSLRKGRNGQARPGPVLRSQGPLHRRQLRRCPRSRQEDGRREEALPPQLHQPVQAGGTEVRAVRDHGPAEV